MSVSVLIYSLITRAYFLGIHIAAMFSSKAQAFVAGRKDWRKNLSAKSAELENCIWFHCASAGEFEQGKPIMQAMQQRFPDRKIVVTFFSPSAFNTINTGSYPWHFFYLPLDTKKNARDFISALNPSIALFVKYELWYHYLQALSEKKIPAYLVSAHFKTDSIFFKWYGGLHRMMLRFFSIIFVQSAGDKQLLEKIKELRVTVAGDTRADRVIEIAQQNFEDAIIEKFIAAAPHTKPNILLAGSTWLVDEKLLSALRGHPCFSSWKLIIVPHDVTEPRLAYINQLYAGAVFYTQLSEPAPLPCNVLVVDKVGLLSKLYRYASVAYVGGAFDHGVHNVLEAAVYNCPVICGPKIMRANEALLLQQSGGLQTVSSSANLIQLIETFNAKGTANGNRHFVMSAAGATQRIMDIICNDKH